MATQETIKQITQGGVTRDVEDTTARQGIAGKVDKETGKGLSSNDYTSAEKTKLGNLPTADQLSAQMNAKANDNAVVKTISVNGGTPSTPINGNVNISVEGAAGDDGITPHIGSNGNWWVGPETDSTNDTGIKAQGPQGSVTITDGALATLEVHNALNAYTGLLGMSGAMKLKNNIDAVQANLVKLYNKLANMAFWDSEDQAAAEPVPTLLDWSVPKVTVTLDKTYLSANAMITDASDQEITGTSVSVDEGSGLTLKIKPRTGYAITGSPSATIGGVSQTLTESNGVYTLVLDSITSAITIAISATAGAPWLTAPKSDYSEGGSVVTYGMQQGRSVNPNAGYVTSSITSSKPTVILSPAGYPYSQKIFTTENPDGLSDNNTNPGTETKSFYATGGKRYLNIKFELADPSVASGYEYKIAVACYTSAVIGNTSPSSSGNFPTMASMVGRIGYRTPSDTTDGYSINTGESNVWKFDLNAFATAQGKQAGSVAYVKILLWKNATGQTAGVDTRDWIDDATVKYKFTDD